MPNSTIRSLDYTSQRTSHGSPTLFGQCDCHPVIQGVLVKAAAGLFRLIGDKNRTGDRSTEAKRRRSLLQNSRKSLRLRLSPNLVNHILNSDDSTPAPPPYHPRVRTLHLLLTLNTVVPQ